MEELNKKIESNCELEGCVVEEVVSGESSRGKLLSGGVVVGGSCGRRKTRSKGDENIKLVSHSECKSLADMMIALQLGVIHSQCETVE